MRSWNSKGKRGEEEEQLFLGSDFSLRDRERKIIEIEKEELEKRENEVNDEYVVNIGHHILLDLDLGI